MKKALFAILAAIMAVSIVLSITSCSCGGMEMQGISYGLVHNYYVGCVKIKRVGDKIKSVSIEETEGPSSWAKRSNITDEAAEGVDFTSGGFARRISVGSVTFTATDDSGTKTPSYRRSEDDDTFEQWVSKEENAKFYFERMASGDYKIIKADGSAAPADFSTEKNGLKKGERWLKSKNGYWSGGEGVLGWQGNIDRLGDYILRFGFGSYTGEETLNGGSWVIDGVDTGATLTDFHDYMKLAKQAYEKAM